MRFVAVLFLCLLPLTAQAQGASSLDVTRSIRASWYDCKKAGECSRHKITASGEKFNPNSMTCAHKRLPFGTRLRVHYRSKSTVCRVNDRGPFIVGRELDMARAVARAIGMMGVAVVRVERL